MRVTATAKFIAAGAVVAGALALGAPTAYAEDAVVAPIPTVEAASSSGSDDLATDAERRKPRVYVIGKTTKPHTRQG